MLVLSFVIHNGITHGCTSIGVSGYGRPGFPRLCTADVNGRQEEPSTRAAPEPSQYLISVTLYRYRRRSQRLHERRDNMVSVPLYGELQDMLETDIVKSPLGWEMERRRICMAPRR